MRSGMLLATFRPSIHVWFVLGWLLTGLAANAQQIKSAPANDPTVIWLTPTQAQVQLQDKLALLQPQLSGLTPGTAPHTDLLRRIIFYKAILRAVVKEMPAAQAIEQALPDAASLGGVYEQSFTPKAILNALYAEAVDLLTT